MKVLALLSAVLLLHSALAADFTVYVGNTVYDSNNIPLYMFSYFYPSTLTVKVGDNIKFKANDWELHWVSFYQDTYPGTIGTPGPNGLNFELWTVGNSTNQVNPGEFLSSPPVTLNPGLWDHIGAGRYTTEWIATFPTAGNFTFVCPQHPLTMTGWINVIAADASYPEGQTPTTIDAAAKTAMKADNDTVPGLFTSYGVNGELTSTTAANGAKTYLVYMGFSELGHGGNYNRFYPKDRFTVRVGDTVTFDTSKNKYQPHTVTFNSSGTYGVFEFWNTALNVLSVNLLAAAPTGDPTKTASYEGGYLNSGMMVPAPNAPAQFSVKFTKAGSYSYICFLHDNMAMNGEIIVEAALTSANPGTTSSAAPFAAPLFLVSFAVFSLLF